MTTPLPYENFKTEADAKGYKFILGPSGEVVLRHRKSMPIDLGFERRAKEAKQSAIIKAALTTPDLLKNRIQKAGADNRLERVNNYLNELRDRYVMPAAQAAGGFVGKHSWLGYLPQGENIGRTLGSEAVRGVAPDTMTGKAIGASMLLNPDELALRLAFPTLAGGVAGWASGEGVEQGGLQGLGAAAAGELPHLPNTLNKARRLGRAERTRIYYDDKRPGEKISSILHLPTFDELRARYGNWVRALRDLRVQHEAGARFAEGMDNITDSVRAVSLHRARAIREAFLEKLRVPLNPRQDPKTYMPGLWEEYGTMLKQRAAVLEKGKALIRDMRRARNLRRSIFNERGGMRGSAMIPSTKLGEKTPREALSQLTDSIRSGLDEFHPALGNTYDAVNNEYKTFSAFRDIANIPDSIAYPSGHVNLDAISHELDTNPKLLQSKLGNDDFDAIRQLFRRNASEAPNYLKGEAYFEQPGELSRLRAIMYGTHGHLATAADTIGSVVGGAPLTTKPVGEIPGLIHAVRQAATRPLRLPRLVAGEMANKKLEENQEEK